jgi:glycerol-3-phosphate acyltransferase PlsY
LQPAAAGEMLRAAAKPRARLEDEMTAPTLERVAGACVVFGATLLAAYGVLFVLLLPISQGSFDYSRLVVQPYWMPLALVALVGVISILGGVDAIHARLHGSAGVAGTIGLLLTKVALVLQACMLTWELLLDPIIAAHPDSAFLLRDRVIATNWAMAAFQWVGFTTTALGAPLLGFAVFRSSQFREAPFFWWSWVPCCTPSVLSSLSFWPLAA